MTQDGFKPLEGTRALVTGGARRIGRAICRRLGEAGAHVVIHYNASAQAAEEARAELECDGIPVSLARADLSDPDDAAALLERVWVESGPIDLLVNNASIFPPGSLNDMTLDDVMMNLRINAWAPFTLMRDLARRLDDASREGCAINLLDSRIATGDPNHAAYHLSKLVLAELTRMGALEFAPHLRVTGVAPGPILPPEDKDEHYLQGLIAALPLRRKGSPEEVADAVIFLATARFVTGQVLFVDGGQHLSPGR